MRFDQLKDGIRMGIFILAGILWILGTGIAIAQESQEAASLPEAIHWKQYVFSIPYLVHRDANAPDVPAEVRLFVSSDQGITWNEVSRVPANIKGFTYYAPADGEYWFALQTMDRRGNFWPRGPHRVGLRVIVDTESPRLQLSPVMTPSGKIEVHWQVVDAHLLPSSLQIEAKTDANPTWHTVLSSAPTTTPSGDSGEKAATRDPGTGLAKAPHDGKVLWEPPEIGETAILRATVTDRAGNQTETSSTLSLAHHPDQKDRFAQTNELPIEGQDRPRSPGQFGTVSQPKENALEDQASDSGTDPTPHTASPTNIPSESIDPDLPSESMTDSVGGNRPESWPVDATIPVPEDNIYARDLAGHSWTEGQEGSDSAASDSADTAQQSQQFDAADPSPGSSGLGWQTIPPTGQAAETIPSDRVSNPLVSNASASDSEVPVHLPPIQAERSALRMVNSRSFALDYEVESVGPWGVGRVELWGTADGGATWRFFSDDPDQLSPITVTVDGEGEYGFRILIQSAGANNAPPPRPGDTPDVWIQVDLKPPAAKIDAVRKGQGNLVDHLTIRWTASDERLSEHPISLFYASHLGGPWSTISTQLDNTGQYMWRLPQHVPDQIFIRVEARDQAGNVGIYSTAEPMGVQRPQPTGRIRGVRASD